MNKIYDKLLLVIALLVLAGGLFLYSQASGDSPEDVAVDTTPADNPYAAMPIPESEDVEANWPEAAEQSTGWLYEVFTPPQIFIDAEGQFSIVPITPPPPPVPFGVYLAEIRRNPYRLQLEGYIQEDRSDVSKSLLLFFDEEEQSQVRARPGEIIEEHEFEVRDFEIERIQTDGGGIDKVATATIYDQRRETEIDLIHGERRFDAGVTVVIRSEQDASVDVELTEAPSEFETPSGTFTLEEINLEDSSVTVKKQGTEDREAETKVLSTESSSPESTGETGETDEISSPEENSDDSMDAFDSLF